ncbi:hypothetical protein M758_UG068400 [Ceratodon purpureus]|nr:hypothetical protein M758_UG068400 [Ceratodon purpureus]
MEEGSWDRAVEQACEGEAIRDVEVLTLDGLVKCAEGKLPKLKAFAPFTQLKRLSISNIGLSSLVDFPSLPHLEGLILSDNRIAGGLEHLVHAGLTSLRELDLSNNKIQAVEDLKPLAQLKLELLDLYACPVTRSAEYRAKVFRMMKSLRFLDKTDVTGNERPESEEEESEDEQDVDDLNGDGAELAGEEEGVDVDSNGFAVQEEDDVEEEGKERDDAGEDNEDVEDEEDDEGESCQQELVAVVSEHEFVQGRMINENESDGEEDQEGNNVEVHDVEESEEEELGDEDDGDAVVDGEEEECDEGLVRGPHVSTEGELEVQEDEDEDNENGELGEDDEDDEVEDDAVDNDEGVDEEDDEEEEEEEFGTNYLVQPIGQPEEDEGASDFEPDDEEEDEDFEDEEDDEDFKEPFGLMQNRKRAREETSEDKGRPAKH